ncbi:hypothetical protein [Micromonospora luteifusca]|uniref:hypothetical protein n=1 Tax=Micromonospora luteifusca TaxID=709860 RepID=UPI003F4C9086
MTTDGLAGKSPCRWRTTTIPDPAAGRRPDLVGRDFRVDPGVIDTRWCGDITYINTWQGWLYLATVEGQVGARTGGGAGLVAGDRSQPGQRGLAGCEPSE